jgi:hypothetical protein
MPSLHFPDTLDPNSKITEESHFKTSTEPGIRISINRVSWNALFAIDDNLDPDSNVTQESNTDKAKHFSPKTSTDAGITLPINPVLLNAPLFICDNFDPVSIANVVND